MPAHSHRHHNKLTELCEVLAKQTETVGALVARDKAADRCLSSPAAECDLASWLWITGKSRYKVLVSQQGTGYWSVNKAQGTGQSTRHRILVSQQDTGYWSTRHRILVNQQDTGYWSINKRAGVLVSHQGTGYWSINKAQGTGQSTRHRVLVKQEDMGTGQSTRGHGYWSINKRANGTGKLTRGQGY